MDKRIFVEKKADFRVKSHSLVKELKHNLQLKTLNDLRIVQVYDVFNLAEDLFARAEKHIFSEQVTDTVLDEAAVKADLEKYAFFAIESLPGQFDQRAASSQEALLLLGSSNDVTVNTAQLYLVNKDIDANELEAVKNYLLNPVDSRFKDITVGIAKQDFSESDKTIPSLDFFETYTAEDFAKYKAEQGLAMEVDDLLFIQDYFKSIGRVPTETELKVLDTYWSDHCRHTTFETELKNIDFSASKFEKQLQATYDKYIAMRDELGRTEKPQTLMDMATIFGRYERANGRLDDMEVSDEIKDRYLSLIHMRKEHIPLQHITGTQEFMGFDFFVNENVLVPRQDTECLVENVLPFAHGKKILDMCTGSGCIIISLKKLEETAECTGADCH